MTTFWRNMRIMYDAGGKQELVQIGQGVLGGVCLGVIFWLLSSTTAATDFLLLDFYWFLLLIYFCAPLSMVVIYVVQYQRTVKPAIAELTAELAAEARYAALRRAFDKQAWQ